MRARRATGVISTIAMFVLLAGCQQRPGTDSPATEPRAAEQAASDAAGSEAVDLAILDFAGIERLIASHRGQVVVMDAWSTSCAPCIKEFPQLVELHARYGPERLACISLSFDYEGIGTPEEQAPRVRKFLERQRATFENVLSSEESDALYRKLKLSSVPAVFVYDKSGRLRKRFDNEQAQREADAFTYQQVDQLVAELLDEDTEQAADEPGGGSSGQ